MGDYTQLNAYGYVTIGLAFLNIYHSSEVSGPSEIKLYFSEVII